MNKETIAYEDFVVAPNPKQRSGQKSGSPIEEVELALARARRLAHADGFEAGKKSAEATFDRKMAAKLDAIDRALIHAMDALESRDRSTHWAVVQLTKAFIHAVAPRLASSALVPEICAAIEESLQENSPTTFVIEVSQSRYAEVHDAIKAFTDGVSVKSNTDLGETEARIFSEGGFDRIHPTDAISKAMRILDARLAKTQADEIDGRGSIEETQA